MAKLSDADSEQYETQHWIEIAHECKYLNEDNVHKLLHYCESVGKMLNSMIDKASLFCQQK